MKTAHSFLCLLALIGIGCTTHLPFKAQTDCSKITYCGQCASRGECAWCGSTQDSSGGQCIAVGLSECSAPRALCQTPDRCPPPPVDAVAPSLAMPTENDASAEQQAIGPQKYGAIKGALVQTFPQAHVPNKLVDKVVRLLLYRGSGPNEDGTHREVALISRRVTEKQHRLYLGNGIHYRVKSLPPASAPMQSEFMTTLPMVRVTLPEKLDTKNFKIDTVIGEVDLSRDHLLGSIELVSAKYSAKEYLGYQPARIDLITPARHLGSRFGAIAVYLGYRNLTDLSPSFYLLEAGTATGEPKMIYFSPTMNSIESVTSYYLPTPFVSMRNTYGGGVTMQPAPNADEPERLVVHSYVPGSKEPYITVTVKYTRTSTIDLPSPLEITADAGARIALIARTMGLSSVVALEELLSNLGRNLYWMEYPRYETPTEAGKNPAAPMAH